MKVLYSVCLSLIFIGYLSAQPTFQKQGHRGSRGLMPENTVAAMKKALDLGVTTLELDVVISKDKQVVVSHDHYMSAEISLKPDGTPVAASEEKEINLYQMTYAEIKKYDVGSKHHAKFEQQLNFPAYKPLLSELIDSVNLYVKERKLPAPFFNIEIKSMEVSDDKYHPKPEEFVKLVMAICKDKKILKRMTIQSFDARPLQLIHKQHPQVILAYLTYNTKTVDENLVTLGFTPYTYSPYYKNVTSETVKACHCKNMKIVPWTVNTKEEIDALMKLDVDGIITDYPNLFDK